jgi:hypothetical protein
MKKQSVVSVVILMLIISGCASSKRNVSKVDLSNGFKAEQVIINPSIPIKEFQEIKQVVYVKGGSSRTEIKQQRSSTFMIYRVEKSGDFICYTVNPDRKEYRVDMIPKSELNPISKTGEINASGFKKTITKLGSKRLLGFDCEGSKEVTDINGQIMKSEKWYNKQLKFDLYSKTIDTEGGESIIETRSITFQKLPDSMFKIPKGYKKVANKSVW